MNYELFRHNLETLRSVSWSEDRAGDKVLFELMDTAKAITNTGVKLPKITLGFRNRHLKLKNLRKDCILDLTHECWSKYSLLVNTFMSGYPGYPEGGRLVIYISEDGKCMWDTYGF